MAAEGKVSIIDTTQQLEWELTKEAYDSCAFPNCLSSPVFKIQVGKQESKWMIRVWPKGTGVDENKFLLALELLPANVKYFVHLSLGLRYPDCDNTLVVVDELYKHKLKSYQKVFDGNASRSKERMAVWHSDNGKIDYRLLFKNDSVDKVTLVTTLVIYVKGETSIHHKEVVTNFVANHRSIADLEMFSDFTIVCGDKRFKCHRNVLASRSSIFKTMLTNENFSESKEGVVEIVDSTPEMVEAMLKFMTQGAIPPNIDAIASDLINLAQKYDLQDLMKACERSLVDNMTVENVIDTLVTLDLYNPISDFRPKVIDFIKSNAKEVTKVKDWTKFVQKYPNLITEVVLSFANQS